MKLLLRLLLLLIAMPVYFANGQLTKLSNNTNLSGLLVGDRPVLVSDNDNTLWTTNGTEGSTLKYTLKVIFDTTNDGGAGVLGNKVYFSGIDSTNGSELWATDGTDGGTALIKDIVTGSSSSTPSDFFVYNNELYFSALTAATGKGLWKTNGTSAGTALVKDIKPGAGGSFHYFVNNGTLYFTANDGTHGNELWKTNGTTAGTALVKDIRPGFADAFGANYNAVEFIGLGTLTLFAADDGTGTEIWKTDGTEAGTVKVKDISSNRYGSFPGQLTAFNNKILFTAETPDEGYTLWVTDGTTAGTFMIKDLNANEIFATPELYSSVIFNNRLVFTAFSNSYGYELWSTDGTPSGTTVLKDLQNSLLTSLKMIPITYAGSNLTVSQSHTPPFNGKAFLIVTDAARGTELWITDGTSLGTKKVKTINPTSEIGFLGIDYFYTQNDLYFVGKGSNATGNELWKSDGTEANTMMINDIYSGEGSSDPTFNFVYNNHLYITANDGDNTVGLTDFFLLDENVTVLPLTLLNFAAAAQPSSAVKIKWNTTNEINTVSFDLERSADGIHFNRIYSVNDASSTEINHHYEYTDYQPLRLNETVLFYRLKITDKEGTFKYSSILPVRFGQSALQLSLSPNPVQDQLSVVVASGGFKTAVLKVTDVNGKQVYTKDLSALPTVNEQNINVSSWQKGMYYLQLITDGPVKVVKFIKQ